MDKTWLDTCITAGEFLYGEYPVSVLKTLYETKGEKITTEQIMEYYDSGSMMVCDGETVSPLIATTDPMLGMFKEADKNGNPYASLHFDLDELEVLRKENSTIEDQPYWIPTAKQIEELVENGYISSPGMTALEEKVRSVGSDPTYLKSLWPRLSVGKIEMLESINAIISGMYPEASGLEEGAELPPEMMKSVPTIHSLNAMLPMVNEFLNSVNNRNRKGWPPAELFKKQHPRGLTTMPTIMPGSAHAAQTIRQAESQLRAMGANVDYSSIDSFATIGPYGERRVVKVGRNDPCPCGSGKKYKHCHGR